MRSSVLTAYMNLPALLIWLLGPRPFFNMGMSDTPVRCFLCAADMLDNEMVCCLCWRVDNGDADDEVGLLLLCVFCENRNCELLCCRLCFAALFFQDLSDGFGLMDLDRFLLPLHRGVVLILCRFLSCFSFCVIWVDFHPRSLSASVEFSFGDFQFCNEEHSNPVLITPLFFHFEFPPTHPTVIICAGDLACECADI